MRSVNSSSLRVTNRVSFAARPNATRTPMSKRTMHPAVDPGITPGSGNRQEQKRDTPKRNQTSTMANTTERKASNVDPDDTLGGGALSKRKVSSQMESWPVCGKKWYNEKLKTHMICDWRLDPANPTCPKDHPVPKANLARLVVSLTPEERRHVRLRIQHNHNASAVARALGITRWKEGQLWKGVMVSLQVAAGRELA